MKSFFIRANQSLRPGESIQKVNYTKLIRLFRENKKESEKSLEINSHLFPYTPPLLPHQAKITCNFDFNLYDHSIFIEDYHPKKGHPVALRDSRGNSLLGVANLSYNEILPFDESFLFKGDSPSRGKAFCMINNHTIKNNIYMMSYGAYDSAQHLYHLLQYNAPTSTSLMELDQFLRFPRHLFMLNPPRMIYESGRSSKEQLQSFLSLNFPIYHYRNLGHIWSFAHFESFKQFGLLLDDREESTLSCLENL